MRSSIISSFSSTAPAPSVISTLSLHDALPIWRQVGVHPLVGVELIVDVFFELITVAGEAGLELRIGREELEKYIRSEEHTSELQSRPHLVCRLLLEKKKRDKHA